ncbi:MAG: hypothetical protein HOV79_22885, partial [Hamadaea sp.]|nr:hypothetical protein [Hamadaea sp.]
SPATSQTVAQSPATSQTVAQSPATSQTVAQSPATSQTVAESPAAEVPSPPFDVVAAVLALPETRRTAVIRAAGLWRDEFATQDPGLVLRGVFDQTTGPELLERLIAAVHAEAAHTAPGERTDA